MSDQTFIVHTESPEYFPVSLDAIDNSVLVMDLYLKSRDNERHVLYRSSGIDFREKDRQRLIDQGVDSIYVPTEQYGRYQRAITERLNHYFKDLSQDRSERGKLIRGACTTMIENVLRFPGRSQAIETVSEISRRFAGWAAEDSGQFSYLLDMSAHDYYTATHMVNVGGGCGLLIGALRPNEIDLHAQIVQGALLHDVGKRWVPPAILNKEGKLDPAEWRLLKRHPLSGYGELAAHDSLSDAALEMTRDHHERLDGTGYPNGISAERIGFAARVCTVVDVFDAISSSRPHRGPTAPLDTLEIMREGRGTHFDPDILEAWCEIVNRMVSDDPGRAVPSSGVTPDVSLNDFIAADPKPQAAVAPDGRPPNTPPPVAIKDARAVLDYWTSERRCYPRYACPLTVRVSFVRQRRQYAVKPGEWFNVQLADIGGAGVRLSTRWAFTPGDILLLEMHTRTGQAVTRQAKVVYVRAAGAIEWSVGLHFIDDNL